MIEVVLRNGRVRSIVSQARQLNFGRTICTTLNEDVTVETAGRQRKHWSNIPERGLRVDLVIR
jgi:hypothetical protein